MMDSYKEAYIVRFHELACFSIECDGKILVFDPHDGKSLGLAPPKVRNADIVLCSHAHYDHNAGKTLVAKKYAFILEEEAGEFSFDGVTIYGTRVRHGGAPQWGHSVVYSVQFPNGAVFIHMGDIGYFPTEKELADFLHLGRPNVLFTPVGGEFTIDASTAVQLARAIKPLQTTVGCHYLYGPLWKKKDFEGMVDEGPFVDLVCGNLSNIIAQFTSRQELQPYSIFIPSD